jgi:SAM-dependent methyltransferase
MTTQIGSHVNVGALEQKVKAMYEQVALHPDATFHFEMGRALAERLGYEPGDLNAIPAAAIESFAGVGYHFDLADLRPGEAVADLGSGSGMDTFIAAAKVGPAGAVVGIDMTDAQLAKAERLRGGTARCGLRRGHQQRRHQPRGRQGCRVPRGGPRAEARRAPGDL